MVGDQLKQASWRQLALSTGKVRKQQVVLKGFMTDYGLLWGATAQILLNLIKQVSPRNTDFHFTTP